MGSIDAFYGSMTEKLETKEAFEENKLLKIGLNDTGNGRTSVPNAVSIFFLWNSEPLFPYINTVCQCAPYVYVDVEVNYVTLFTAS